MDKTFEMLKKELPGVKKQVPLAAHTTFNIGGPAEYFLPATTQKEILRAIRTAKKIKLPVFVMGGGSNLLVSDSGVRGVVLKKNNVVEAPAGAVLGKVIDFSISKSLQGLEWAGGLPGTFGGGIRGNAGAFGGEMKDTIVSVRALDDQFNLRKLSNGESGFSYRSSIFKRKNWVVLSAQVKLKKGNKKKLKEISNSRKDYRKEKHPLEYPNAGSVFKNVAVKDLAPIFQSEFADKVKQDPFPIVPAAWFIIGAGLAGKKVGRAQISQKHSNYIVNLGGAKAKDVLALIDMVKNNVKNKYGIVLEMEVQYLE